MGGSRLCGCVSMFCFHCFAMPVLNAFHQSTTRLRAFFFLSSRLFFGFERLDFVSSPCFDGFAFFVLHFRNAGPSRRRVEQANLYGLCFAISPEPSCEPRPHISETYQLIGRIEEARQWLRTAAFGCLESSK